MFEGSKMNETFSFDATRFSNVLEKSLLSDVGDMQRTTLSDGTKIDTDANGKVLQANYASGVQVRINTNFCLVKSGSSQYWYGDNNGRWYPLD